MSSTAFCAEILPETGLRRIVLATGVIVVLAGAMATAAATVSLWVRLPTLCAWLFVSGLEIAALRRGWHCCRRVRVAAGGAVEVLDACGHWVPARLANGSVLLRRYGWLRLVTDNGTRIHELVRGRCRQSHDWRRLHVIWRHV